MPRATDHAMKADEFMKRLRLLTWGPITRQDLIFAGVCIIACCVLLRLPTGFEGARSEGRPVAAKVITVDDSHSHTIGLIRTGSQSLTIEVTGGQDQGRQYEVVNHYLGKLELDKVYRPGDTVLAVLQGSGDRMDQAEVVDRYRMRVEGVLVGLFVVFMLIFAGWVGVKSILSFFFTALMIWKILLPGYLNNYHPVALTLLIMAVLCGVIIFLVAGFTRKGVIAFSGAFAGVGLTCLFSLIFGHYFAIPGVIKPFAETLLYTGFPRLNLSDIFLAGIFLASSGAVMDIAMDVAASMTEIKKQKPDINMADLTLAGFSVGRAVVGTMTTTLLLAYSGGYSTLLMVLIAQGVPMTNILNIQYIAAEILHTMVGSFGLVLVAPLTALIGGFMLTRI